MNPDDKKALEDILEMLKKRGIQPSRVKLPSGLEITFGPLIVQELEDPKGDLLSDEKAEKERRRSRDKLLGIT